MLMNLLELLDRIYSVLEKLDPKHPNVKKVNKILSTAEKALLAWAKIVGIRIDDIKEIKGKPWDYEKDPLEKWDEEWTPKEESKESPEDENAEQDKLANDENQPEEWDDKKVKIKMMFWKLSPEKQAAFKDKMWDKFNSLWI